MRDYLGVDAVTPGVQHQNVTGAGPFAGLGFFAQDYPYPNRSDAVSPAAGASLAFSGSAGDAGVARDGGNYRATFWGFGLGTIDGAGPRAEVMGAVVGWCDDLDGDGDGVVSSDDCSPLLPEAWETPGPARALTVGPGMLDNLSWLAPDVSGGSIVYFDVLRGQNVEDLPGATCIETGLETTLATDGDVPPSGGIYFYLIQARNDCGATIGPDSSGTPRIGPSCF